MFFVSLRFTFVVRYRSRKWFRYVSRKWLRVGVVRSSAAIFALAIFVADHLRSLTSSKREFFLQFILEHAQHEVVERHSAECYRA